MSLDLVLEVFSEIEGAERAYADVRGRAGDAPWIHEIAFVEHHRRDRIVVRGSFAGRYVDVEDQNDPIGAKTAEGALTGAIAVILLAGADHADAMVAAFEGHGGRLVRRHLSPETARALEVAVAGDPPAAASSGAQPS